MSKKGEAKTITVKRTGAQREFEGKAFAVEGTKSEIVRGEDVLKMLEERKEPEKPKAPPEIVRGEDVLKILRAKGRQI